MSLFDPFPINLDGTDYSLPRVSVGQNQSSYYLDTDGADGRLRVTASTSYGKRIRSVVRVDQNKILSNLLVSGSSFDAGMSFYCVMDSPLQGFAVADKKVLAKALIDWTRQDGTTTDGSLKNLEHVIRGES
ncbi:TPA_asm: coat protein [ssRNA phage Esthiorhiza.2_20]|uniref:Coat protein n=2 Tax=Leviviricetes TaxID=2842243 RepID=A0A8S5L3J8_9VIRU|nr:coat protein [ssRNA phage Esthiorhiza.2_20]QDH89925.1 MAG: hypothetical protein H2RhizoLitter491385_000002 [Leviviridae sp.]DAD51996.1 TPA_asm: coat protein [ssRNA phage Esthiorhiza.2_20]